MTKVGRLTVGDRLKQNGRWYVFTTCDCGAEKPMQEDYIKRGQRRGLEISCGCRQKEMVAQTGYKNRKFDYDRRKLRNAHKNMVDRCTNPSNHRYASYGGRGISVCIEWQLDIEKFISDVGLPEFDNYQLDRIDTNGNYEPGNVQWVSPTENVRNRRNTKLVTAWGETKPLATWCEETGQDYDIVKQRLNKLKWSPERALSEVAFRGKNQTFKSA